MKFTGVRYPLLKMVRSVGIYSAVLVFAGASAASNAGTVYEAPQTFVQKAFVGAVPQLQTLWLNDELQQGAKEILNHSFATLRVRYWQAGGRTAWVLDEVGKERPITLGVVVDGGQIAEVKVLTYRESRGAEVRQTFFTRQFIGATLNPQHRLDRGIDGVTGATMSVRAVKRVAQIALLFHEHVMLRATTLAQQ